MQVIAHRGGATLRVENTLAAFEHAIALGADGAELDVHLTRDGQVVVHHDDALNPGYCRGEDGAWIDAAARPRIADLDFATLQRYDIGTPRPGSDYACQHPRVESISGERIPRLVDVIRRAKARSPTFRLTIEIKTAIEAAAHQPWRTLVDATLQIIRAEAFLERAILCSFDWSALVAAKRACPELATWFTTNPMSWFEPAQPPPADDPPPAAELQLLRSQYQSGAAPWLADFDPRGPAGSYPAAIARAGGDAWFVYDRDCTAERVRAAAQHGIAVATWGPNVHDRNDVTRLARTGVAAVCLDDPTTALNARPAI